MLTIVSEKNHTNGVRRLLAVAAEHQFVEAEPVNAPEHDAFGLAPPSSRSRRAARLRRRARANSSGWRAGIGAW